jgi:predicted DNA repair protein MutK
MVLFSLAYRSLLNRKLTTIVTLLSLGLSVSLWVGIEHIRRGARESFSNTISQTDLIIGARGSPIQLLLYTVFRPLTSTQYSYLACVVLGGIAVGLIPAWKAYRNALSDGLSVRV